MMNVSVSNKHYTTWKMLCTVFPRSLFLYQKSHSFDTVRPHFQRSMHNLCSRRIEVVWGARGGHMQARGGGGNLPTAMVQFCAIISAPFHLRAHFWVPHLNFLTLLRVRVSTDTLPGPNNKPCSPLTILSPPPLTFLWRAQVYREKSFKEGQYMCSVITWYSRN